MKALKIIFIALAALMIKSNCSAQNYAGRDTEQVTNSTKIEVYYFHYTRRCATCNAVESVSKDAVAEFYGDKVSFSEYNLDEQAGKSKGKEFKFGDVPSWYSSISLV